MTSLEKDGPSGALFAGANEPDHDAGDPDEGVHVAGPADDGVQTVITDSADSAGY